MAMNPVFRFVIEVIYSASIILLGTAAIITSSDIVYNVIASVFVITGMIKAVKINPRMGEFLFNMAQHFVATAILLCALGIVNGFGSVLPDWESFLVSAFDFICLILIRLFTMRVPDAGILLVLSFFGTVALLTVFLMPLWLALLLAVIVAAAFSFGAYWDDIFPLKRNQRGLGIKRIKGA